MVGSGWPLGAPSPLQAPLQLPAPMGTALRHQNKPGHGAGLWALMDPMPRSGLGTPKPGSSCPCVHPRAGGHRGCRARGRQEPALLTLVLCEGSISFPARLCFSALISQTIATHKGKGTARMPGVWRARQEHKADLQQRERFCAAAKRRCFSLPAARGRLRSGSTKSLITQPGLGPRQSLPPALRVLGCLGCIK